MDYVFEIIDKTGRKIHLSKERWKHMLKHPYMHDQLENIKITIQNPTTIRYYEEDEDIRYFYKEFKNRDPLEKYLLVSVKYLNFRNYIKIKFLIVLKNL